MTRRSLISFIQLSATSFASTLFAKIFMKPALQAKNAPGNSPENITLLWQEMIEVNGVNHGKTCFLVSLKYAPKFKMSSRGLPYSYLSPVGKPIECKISKKTFDRLFRLGPFGYVSRSYLLYYNPKNKPAKDEMLSESFFSHLK
jgi:hypothetical protein